MDSNISHMILMMVVALVCAIILAAAVALLPLSAFAQQEEASLGDEEKEHLADSIVSNVLNGRDDDGDRQMGDTNYESNEHGTVSATVSRSEEQNGNEDIVGGSANDTTHLTAEQHAGNVSIPLILSIDTTADEETPTTPPPDDAQK